MVIRANKTLVLLDQVLHRGFAETLDSYWNRQTFEKCTISPLEIGGGKSRGIPAYRRRCLFVTYSVFTPIPGFH